jgi:PPOX class probable F420-dependent enzyme
MTHFAPLTNQQYLNLETFRKTGVSVKTPVWFVRDGDILYVRTGANSGKVKRIRNNGQVNVAPCKADGALLGEWIAAQAREIKDAEMDQKVNRLLDRKYGLMKKLFGLFSAIQRLKETIVEIRERE